MTWDKLRGSLAASVLAGLYAEGALTPAAVVEAVHARIAVRGRDNVWIHLLPKGVALAAAAALGAKPDGRPLWGLPFAIKDNIDLAGAPTTAACPDFAYAPARSAAAVERLVAAGAIPIGKTNLDQFATGLIGTRSPYGTPVNPFDAASVPGGSSSGSAVAVASGLVSFALGTDTAGSGRVPAAFNNVVGLKPTRGLVSARGVVPACRSLDCVSVFALTADDALAALAAMAGFDPADAFSRADADAIRLVAGAAPPSTRIGVPRREDRRFFGDDEAARRFDEALARLARLGATIVELDFAPFFEVARLLYDGPFVAERLEATATLLARWPDALWPATRAILEGAWCFSASDMCDGLYRLAALRRATAPIWRDVDALCVPTAPTHPTLAADAAEPLARNAELGTYTNFVNFLDLAAIAVPAGFRADGRPVGVTLIAEAGRDAWLVALGDRLHRDAGVPLGATGHASQPAQARPTAAQAGEVPLAVVGAHLSGEPLNHQLASRGGRLLAATTTAPRYRLHALAGGPPARPGLQRVASGGAVIEVEVWGVAREALGALLAEVPPPLAIGSLELADGTWVKGFVCEPWGLSGAEDITAFGGWRAFRRARG